MDTAKFIPAKTEPLMPESELELIGDVTDADITAAAESWKVDPPDRAFELILEAQPSA